jgi:Uma2 family endonuclease
MATVASMDTIAELVAHLGGIPLDRIRLRPAPGTATAADALTVERREGKLCEVIDGVLVEKPIGYYESRIAVLLGRYLDEHLEQNDLGIVTGADGPLMVEEGQLRYPDLAFFAWDKFPNRVLPRDPILDHVPDLAIEVLSKSNTPREMRRKRREYFDAGARLVWEVNPVKRTVRVYTAFNQSTTLREGDMLDGGDVLPGFTLSLATLFRRAGRRA